MWRLAKWGTPLLKSATLWLNTPQHFSAKGWRSMPWKYFSTAWVARQDNRVDATFSWAQPITSLGATVGAAVRVSAMGPDGDPDFQALHPAITHNPQSGEKAYVGGFSMGLRRS